jgi:DHA2 family multidrug resistance protein
MSGQGNLAGSRGKAAPYALLITGIIMAGLAEAFTGTGLSFGKLDMWGDLYTTPDEFALLDVGYIAAKLCGFMMVPALFARFRPLGVMLAAATAISIFSTLMACTSNLHLLIIFRVIQGTTGGILLVGGQTLLFNVFLPKQQPVVQLLFALGAIVFPGAFVSYFQGWMVDALSWEAIFLAAAGFGIASLSALAGVPWAIMHSSGSRRTDIPGMLLFVGTAVCLTYIAQEGSRWNWFEAEHVLAMTVCGFTALLACILRWVGFAGSKMVVSLSVFSSRDFCFGFPISFVAGVALFGSTWLIPGFSLTLLGFTATDAGMLVVPGGAMFLIGLSLTALLLCLTRVSPLATVPLGIFLIMAGMWMLSGSTSESGTADLLLPLMIRGIGLGFLFLSLTLYALGGIRGSRIAQGVALFTTLRQFGGLFGVAFLQRYLDHQNALNESILSSHLELGGVHLAERLFDLQAVLQSRGMEAGEAAKVSTFFLKKSLETQSGILSYNEAFFAITIVFCIAIPLLISFKIWLIKRHSCVNEARWSE